MQKPEWGGILVHYYLPPFEDINNVSKYRLHTADFSDLPGVPRVGDYFNIDMLMLLTPFALQTPVQIESFDEEFIDKMFDFFLKSFSGAAAIKVKSVCYGLKNSKIVAHVFTERPEPNEPNNPNTSEIVWVEGGQNLN